MSNLSVFVIEGSKHTFLRFLVSKNVSFFWNFGSFLGLIFALQTFSGIILVFYYESSESSFDSVDFLVREVYFGYLFRIVHLNGASFFFLFLFFHIFRGLFYQSFVFSKVWLSGSLIFSLLMAVAFLGYVLPWGQMSFWGATVITNLISTIPVFGPAFVLWLWGGFNINKGTLSLFFTLHYLLPFLIWVLVLFHLLFLHELGSSSSLRSNSNLPKVSFYPYFLIKDSLNLFLFVFFYGLVLVFPWSLGDPENWTPANPMVSPTHIQPEWYFLFAYAILRSVPNKVGGVLSLVLSVLVLFIIPLLSKQVPSNKLISSVFIFSFLVVWFLLTWLGGQSVEAPYIFLGQVLSFLYFLSLFGLTF